MIRLLFFILIFLSGECLNKLFKQYEPLNYQGSYQSRVSRSDDGAILLNFHAYDRDFKLIIDQIQKTDSVFMEGATIEYDNETSKTEGDSNMYTGTIEDEDNSDVLGSIHDGIFEGMIKISDGEEFWVEIGIDCGCRDDKEWQRACPERISTGIVCRVRHTHESSVPSNEEYCSVDNQWSRSRGVCPQEWDCEIVSGESAIDLRGTKVNTDIESESKVFPLINSFGEFLLDKWRLVIEISVVAALILVFSSLVDRRNEQINGYKEEIDRYKRELEIVQRDWKKDTGELKEELKWSRGEIARLTCPFLSLPNELIAHIFSFLPIKDRLRARVNKKLDKIELECKYFVEKLLIIDLPVNDPFRTFPWVMQNSQRFILDRGTSYPSDCIKRITQNASFGWLGIRLPVVFGKEVVSLISKECNIGYMYLQATFNRIAIVGLSFHPYMARMCKELEVCHCDNTLEELHELYTTMIDGSAKLRRFGVEEMSEALGRPFLARLGVTYREDGQFYSNRDIEIYKDDEEITDDGPIFYAHIFDGNVEITVAVELLDSPVGYFGMKLHETAESLEKAKNGEKFVRVQIRPE